MKTNLNVVLKGGASSNNVYWIAGTAASFDAGTVSEGNVFSGTAGITFAAGCTHNGRYFSTNTLFLSLLSCLPLPLSHGGIFYSCHAYYGNLIARV